MDGCWGWRELRWKRSAEALNDRAEGGGVTVAAVVDVVPTFRSLTVHYDPLRCDGQRLGEELLLLARSTGSASARGRQWRIPVCFDDDCAPDLADLAQSKGMAREAVIALMIRTEFQVYMIGFMPGFPIWGGCRPNCRCRACPRQESGARTLAGRGWRDVRRVSVGKPRRLEATRAHTGADVRGWRLTARAARLGRPRTLAGHRPCLPPTLRWNAPASPARSTGAPCVLLAKEKAHERPARSHPRRARQRPPGHRAIGLPAHGHHRLRLSRHPLARCANALVGNDADAAYVQIRVLGPVLRVKHGPVRVAIVGNLAPKVRRADSQDAAPAWTSVMLESGDELETGTVKGGITWLSVAAYYPRTWASRSLPAP